MPVRRDFEIRRDQSVSDEHAAETIIRQSNAMTVGNDYQVAIGQRVDEKLFSRHLEIIPVHPKLLEDLAEIRATQAEERTRVFEAGYASGLFRQMPALVSGGSIDDGLELIATMSRHLANNPSENSKHRQRIIFSAIEFVTNRMDQEGFSHLTNTRSAMLGHAVEWIKAWRDYGGDFELEQESADAQRAAASHMNPLWAAFNGLAENYVAEAGSELVGYFEQGVLELDEDLQIELLQPAIVKMTTSYLGAVAADSSNPREALAARAFIPRAPLSATSGGFVLEDAYVRSNYPNSNYGSSSWVYADNYRDGWFKINLSPSEDITSASITLHGLLSGSGTVAMAFDNNWSESSLTWNNSPADVDPNFANWTINSGQSTTIDISEQARRARFIGDADADGVLNVQADVAAFELAIKDANQYVTAYGLPVSHSEALLRSDTNSDGAITGGDAERFFRSHGYLQTDVNLDGVYDIVDFNQLGANYQNTNAVFAEGDVNFDGNVNSVDLNEMAQMSFGTSGPGQSDPSLTLVFESNSLILFRSTETSSSSLRPSVSIHDVSFDQDGDRLINAVETHLGTDPNNYDTDGDILNDGFEFQADLLDPLIVNNAALDVDGDGLDYLAEQAYSTDPDVTDSDADGTNDGTEASQGSVPNDSNDGGLAPNADDVVLIRLTIGDLKTEPTERFDFQVGHILQHGNFEDFESGDYHFEKGQTYDAQIIHRGTKQGETPKYDWDAIIQRGNLEPENEMIITEDPHGILGPNVTPMGQTFPAQGKTAYLHIPRVDLDVIAGCCHASVADEDEEDVGVFVGLNDDDDDNDQILDFEDSLVAGGDDDLIELKLRSILPSQLLAIPGHFGLSYGTHVDLWLDNEKSQPVTSQTEFAVDIDHTIYLEGVSASDAERDVQIRAHYYPDLSSLPTPEFFGTGFAYDTLNATVVGVDVDTDSDNDEVLARSTQEDIVEDLMVGEKEIIDRGDAVPIVFDAIGDATLDLLEDGWKLEMVVSPGLSLWADQDKLTRVTANSSTIPFDDTYSETYTFTDWNAAQQYYVEGTLPGFGAERNVKWHLKSPAGNIVARDTVQFEVIPSIVVGIGGSNSAAWLASPNAHPDPPNNTRWNSHVRNLVDQAVVGAVNATITRFFDGPNIAGTDSDTRHDEVLMWINGTLANYNGRAQIAIVGYSRGAMIASWVANDLSAAGQSVRFLGMFDPVDMALSIPGSSKSIQPGIDCVVVIGPAYLANHDYQNSSGTDNITIDRESGNIALAAGNTTTSVSTVTLDASHGAMGGTPGYNDGAETDLDGYNYATDVANSINGDHLMRISLKAKGFGVELLSSNQYLFPATNPICVGAAC